MLKALFKDSSPVMQFFLFAVVMCFSFVLFYFFVIALLIMKVGISMEAVQDIQQNLMSYPDLLRAMVFFQNLCFFIFPSIICAWLFSESYKDYLHINEPVRLPIATWTVLSILVAVPLINCISDLNRQMVLPQALSRMEAWMKSSEEANSRLIETVLYTDNPGILIMNIAIVCVLTGIGEEFIFRGLLQNLFGRFLRNPHVVIWLVAALFSAIHFQFYGFFPRLLLGAYFGYLLYHTKTIWIPVLAHFTNNLFGVVSMYAFQDAPQTMKATDTLGTGSTWWLAVASLALFVFCYGRIRNYRL